MTCVSQRQEIVALVDQAVADGATRERACVVIGLSASTLRRWRPTDHDTVIEDGRPLADRPPPANRYSQSEHDRILEFCNRATNVAIGVVKRRPIEVLERFRRHADQLQRCIL